MKSGRRLVRKALLAAASAALFAGASTAQQPPVPVDSARDRIVITGSIPVPKVGDGAPYHSVEEIAALENEAQKDYSDAIGKSRQAALTQTCRDPLDVSAMNPSGRDRLADLARRPPGNTPNLQKLYSEEKSLAVAVTQAARRAAEATRIADDSRRRAATGGLGMPAVEKLELARQAEVKKLEKARLKLMEAQAAISDYGELARSGVDNIGWGDLDARALRRKKAGWGLGLPQTRTPKNLSVANLQSVELQDSKGPFLRIAGVVSNGGTSAAPLPDILISMLDERGLVLSTTLAASNGRQSVPASGALPFVYDMRPSPEHIGRLVMNFASGFEPAPETSVSFLCPADGPD